MTDKTKDKEKQLIDQLISKSFPRILTELMQDLGHSENTEIDNDFLLSYFGSIFTTAFGHIVIYNADLSKDKKIEILLNISKETLSHLMRIINQEEEK